MNGIKSIQDNYNLTLNRLLAVEGETSRILDIRFRLTLSDGTVLPASNLILDGEDIGDAVVPDATTLEGHSELCAQTMRIVLDLPAPLFHPILDVSAYAFETGDIDVKVYVQ
jgi:hypothetical protein